MLQRVSVIFLPVMENFDVTDLSDDELKRMLVRHGFEPGPIVKTTRKLYEKRLIKILQGKNETNDDASPTIIQSKSASPRKKDDSDGDEVKENRTWSPIKPSKPISPVSNTSPLLNIGKSTVDKSHREIENDRMEGEEEYRYVPQRNFGKTSNIFDDDTTTEVRQR